MIFLSRLIQSNKKVNHINYYFRFVNMKVIFTLLFSIVALFLTAQTLPDFIPDDIGGQSANNQCFCKPGLDNTSRSRGLTLAYTLNTPSRFTEEKTPLSESLTSINSLHSLLIDLKVPIINKEGFKVLLAYKYVKDNYDLNAIGADYSAVFSSLDNAILKGNDYGIIISKSLDENKYLAFYGKYGAKGNYNKWTSFDSKYAIYKARLLFGKKPNNDYEWGVGLNFTSSFRNTTIIPFMIINKNFSHKWGFESVLPAYALMRYNLNEKNIFLGGIQVAGQTFRTSFPNEVTTDPIFDYSINRSEFRVTTLWERQIIPWIWTAAQVGYQFHFTTKFEGMNDSSPTFDVDPTNSVFFNLSLFLSPPRHLMK
ncbi:MAG: hypothetical protein ACI85O_002728 [Saprospiraceae bacterium]|jgi:hypothetical protein